MDGTIEAYAFARGVRMWGNMREDCLMEDE